MPKTPILIRFTEKQAKYLHAAAKKLDVSVAEVVRETIEGRVAWGARGTCWVKK